MADGAGHHAVINALDKKMKDNLTEINGHKAIVKFDPEINMFRGEFIGLAHGGADFYADSVAGLRKEGAISLKVYQDMCRERGLNAQKQYSGRLNLRLGAEIHRAVELAAGAEHKSANVWIKEQIAHALEKAAASDDCAKSRRAK